MNIELSKGVNLSVDISDAMIKDYTECQKLAKQNLSNTGCCQSCSMDSDILGYGLCEIPVLVREIKAMQKKADGGERGIIQTKCGDDYPAN